MLIEKLTKAEFLRMEGTEFIQPIDLNIERKLTEVMMYSRVSCFF